MITKMGYLYLCTCVQCTVYIHSVQYLRTLVKLRPPSSWHEDEGTEGERAQQAHPRGWRGPVHVDRTAGIPGSHDGVSGTVFYFFYFFI